MSLRGTKHSHHYPHYLLEANGLRILVNVIPAIHYNKIGPEKNRDLFYFHFYRGYLVVVLNRGKISKKLPRQVVLSRHEAIPSHNKPIKITFVVFYCFNR